MIGQQGWRGPARAAIDVHRAGEFSFFSRPPRLVRCNDFKDALNPLLLLDLPHRSRHSERQTQIEYHTVALEPVREHPWLTEIQHTRYLTVLLGRWGRQLTDTLVEHRRPVHSS